MKEKCFWQLVMDKKYICFNFHDIPTDSGGNCDKTLLFQIDEMKCPKYLNKLIILVLLLTRFVLVHKTDRDMWYITSIENMLPYMNTYN